MVEVSSSSSSDGTMAVAEINSSGGGSASFDQLSQMRMLKREEERALRDSHNKRADKMVDRLQSGDESLAKLLQGAADSLGALLPVAGGGDGGSSGSSTGRTADSLSGASGATSTKATSAQTSPSQLTDEEKQNYFDTKTQDWFESLNEVQTNLREAVKFLTNSGLAPVPKTSALTRSALAQMGGMDKEAGSLGAELEREQRERTTTTLSTNFRRGSTGGYGKTGQSGPGEGSSLLGQFVDVSNENGSIHHFGNGTSGGAGVGSSSVFRSRRASANPDHSNSQPSSPPKDSESLSLAALRVQNRAVGGFGGSLGQVRAQMQLERERREAFNGAATIGSSSGALGDSPSPGGGISPSGRSNSGVSEAGMSSLHGAGSANAYLSAGERRRGSSPRAQGVAAAAAAAAAASGTDEPTSHHAQGVHSVSLTDEQQNPFQKNASQIEMDELHRRELEASRKWIENRQFTQDRRLLEALMTEPFRVNSNGSNSGRNSVGGGSAKNSVNVSTVASA